MKYIKRILLSFVFLNIVFSASSQTVMQQGIVRHITHSKTDVCVPVKGVQIVVGGVSSRKSSSNGKFSLRIKESADRGYFIQDVRFPEGSGYVLAYPSLNKKLFLSKNVLTVSLTTPEEISTVTKENYKRLFRKYRERSNELIEQRNRMEDILLDIDANDRRYKTAEAEVDSIQRLIDVYFDDKNKKSYTETLKGIAAELAVTDYQSLDSTEAGIYDLRYEGEWQALSNELNRVMNGDARSYIAEGVRNRDAARDIAAHAEIDLNTRFRRMEQAIESFKMQFMNDSVVKYYNILIEADPHNHRYLNDAGLFETEYTSDFESAISHLTMALECATCDTMKIATYTNIGLLYSNLNEYDKALENYRKAEVIASGIDSVLNYKVSVLNSIGNALYGMCKYDEAADYCNRALEVNSHVKDGDDMRAAIMGNIGNIYYDRRMYDKALECWNEALECTQRVHGDNKDAAMYYNNISLIYSEKEDYNKALEMCFKALKIRERVFGVYHPMIVNSYINIGGIYHYLDNDAEAVRYTEMALEKALDIYGKKHAAVATCYNNLADYLSDDPEKSIEYNLKSAEILRLTFGEFNTNLSTCYNNIAYTYSDMGNHVKAIEYMLKGFNLEKKILGENSSTLVPSYLLIGKEYSAMDDYEKAVEYFERGIELTLSLSEEERYLLSTFYLEIQFAYSALDMNDKALMYCRKAIDLDTIMLGKNHPKVALEYARISDLLTLAGRYDEAIEFCNTACEVYRVLGGDECEDIASCYDRLGMLYGFKKQYDLAEKFYQMAYDIYVVLLGENNEKTVKLKNDINNLKKKK